MTHLRFVWVVRDTEMMDALPTVATTRGADAEVGEDQEVTSDKLSRFQPEVYVTRASDQDLGGRQNTQKGRPDIEKIILETLAISKGKGRSGRVAVVTCGPESLVDEVKDYCRKSGVNLHDEIFNF